MTRSTAYIGLTSSTIALLHTIAAAILANPADYTAAEFVADYTASGNVGVDNILSLHVAKLGATERAIKVRIGKARNHSNRGTGWKSNPFFLAAKKDLGLSEQQAERLLGPSDKWPKKFGDAYEEAATAKGRARALVNMIEFFIASDGTNEPLKRGPKSGTKQAPVSGGVAQKVAKEEGPEDSPIGLSDSDNGAQDIDTDEEILEALGSCGEDETYDDFDDEDMDGEDFDENEEDGEEPIEPLDLDASDVETDEDEDGDESGFSDFSDGGDPC